jgi:hypothetical protein
MREGLDLQQYRRSSSRLTLACWRRIRVPTTGLCNAREVIVQAVQRLWGASGAERREIVSAKGAGVKGKSNGTSARSPHPGRHVNGPSELEPYPSHRNSTLKLDVSILHPTLPLRPSQQPSSSATSWLRQLGHGVHAARRVGFRRVLLRLYFSSLPSRSGDVIKADCCSTWRSAEVDEAAPTLCPAICCLHASDGVHGLSATCAIMTA